MLQAHSISLGGGYGSAVPTLAIVAAVLILGGSIYVWRRRYIRSRAAFITLAVIIGALLYYGIFVSQPPS